MGEVLKEKCAVAGLSNDEAYGAAPQMYEMLYAMQHRGAEASGITSYDKNRIFSHRAPGMVRDVYTEESISRLPGRIAIGHNRYTTSNPSGDINEQLQPIADMPIGFAFGHNGNLPSTDTLQSHLENHNFRTSGMSDSQMMAAAIAQQIRSGLDLPDAIESSYQLFQGAFSCVAMHDGLVVAFRDPKGIRPLAIGRSEPGTAIVSETCALDIIDAQYVREVEPGEMVILNGQDIESRQVSEGAFKLDMFEFVYFSRHDSNLYGQSVNEVRRRFGERLAMEHPPMSDTTENTLVVPVPDTSVPAAEGYADALGLRHRQAIIKNRFIGRSFMQQTDKDRVTQLRRKHNIIPEAVSNKDVILIDDSIVRLNTMPRLVRLAKEAGARSVQVLVASPPVRFPDYYGIDTPTQSELAAAHMTIEQIRQRTKADYLGYLSLQGMVEATGVDKDMFNLSCFTGNYPIAIGNRKKEISTPVSMEGI